MIGNDETLDVFQDKWIQGKPIKLQLGVSIIDVGVSKVEDLMISGHEK